MDETPVGGRLDRALLELAALREENARLRRLIEERGGFDRLAPRPSGDRADVTRLASEADKVALFRSLFRGREDVFAVRWEARDGRAGYAPANRYDPMRGAWRARVDEGARDEHVRLTDAVLRDHLIGKHVVGVYPLLLTDECWFLAIDFDKAGWREDVAAVLDVCDELAIPASLERSRSGRGGHVWVFFAESVPAVQARKLGCAVLTRTMERRHQLGLDSYDRLFPNQDTLPYGGFGNLIALPLQRAARARHDTEFLDRDFVPYPDQWAYLASVRRMSAAAVDAVVQDAARADAIIGVRLSLAEEDDKDPWTRPPSRRRAEPPIAEPLPATVRVVHANQVYVEKAGLPSAMLNRLARLAAFQNPEFYKAQAMRLSTFGKPRVISCGEDLPRHLGLPRGCLPDVLELLGRHGVWPTVADERFAGAPLDVRFRGELTPAQEEAARALLAHDTGVLSAPTAFGKTVVAAWLIGERQINTLVLVHRQHLLDQWRERLGAFLDLPAAQIGQVGAGRRRPTGQLDVALIQSLGRKGEVDNLVAGYGQVIVDECHHIPAFSFERVLREAKARYVVGLSATPVRKDGHHPIVVMQCGPIRHRVDALAQAAARPFEHVLIPHTTAFNVPPETEAAGIQRLYARLAADPARNDLIVADVLRAVSSGRSPLVLTERTDHLELLADRFRPAVPHLVVLRGGMGAKQRRATLAALAAIPPAESRVLLATGRYVGEGFDDARLDTLFLAMPVSWRGTIQQYAGRLHRLHATKQVVQVYDYVDASVPVLARMYGRRLKGYKAIGYAVQPPAAT